MSRTGSPRAVLIASREIPLARLVQIKKALEVAHVEVTTLLYRDPIIGDKSHLSISNETLARLRKTESGDVKLLEAPLPEGLIREHFGAGVVVFSFESPDRFVKIFNIPRTTWIQVQSGGDLLVSIAKSRIIPDGLGLMGERWLSPAYLNRLQSSNSERDSLTIAATRPAVVLGHPSLERFKQSWRASGEKSERKHSQVTLFEPNWLPKTDRFAFDLAFRVMFATENWPGLRRLQQRLDSLLEVAVDQGIVVNKKGREKSQEIHLGRIARQAGRVESRQSPWAVMSESMAIITFLPSFSIWESLFLGVRPLVLDPRRYVKLSPALLEHPQFHAFEMMREESSMELLVNSGFQLDHWVTRKTLPSPTMEGVVAPWLSPVVDLESRVLELMEKTLKPPRLSS